MSTFAVNRVCLRAFLGSLWRAPSTAEPSLFRFVTGSRPSAARGRARLRLRLRRGKPRAPSIYKGKSAHKTLNESRIRHVF
jgi:hypothetical protein